MTEIITAPMNGENVQLLRNELKETLVQDERLALRSKKLLKERGLDGID
jgi:hypothetical protein